MIGKLYIRWLDRKARRYERKHGYPMAVQPYWRRGSTTGQKYAWLAQKKPKP